MTGDDFIKLGFWSQLLLLVLVDWGTLLAFARGGVPWYHYVGFAAVNVILLGAAWRMWGWLRQKRSRPIGFTPKSDVAPALSSSSDSDSP
ncbi:MAG TPA: hypothetical protein DIU15_06300 [Deltaproteobacteria bacterium]|nr:hypothetical protein [Deltaproteobacteria bacterium]HCP45631.1 hypothetical protein [Deltaproteobacteria bacterium]